MTNTIPILSISGNIFQEIEYNTINELYEKLKLLITYYDSDISIQLLINENILNNADIIDMLILSKLSECDYILIVFGFKKELYCLNNENGKYILDNKNNNYSKLLKIIILRNQNKSYDIIKNTSYKELVLQAIKQDKYVLEYVSNELKNNEEVVLKAIKRNGLALQYASKNLKNNKKIVSEAVQQNGISLYYTSIHLRNDKEIVLHAVKQNGYALHYASIYLQNDKDIVHHAVKQNKHALKYASIELQNSIDFIEILESMNN